jgi:hypothetical protein
MLLRDRGGSEPRRMMRFHVVTMFPAAVAPGVECVIALGPDQRRVQRLISCDAVEPALRRIGRANARAAKPPRVSRLPSSPL